MITEDSDMSEIEIPVEISGLFRQHYDRMMITDSITNIDSLLICMYLLEYTNQKAGVSYKTCKKLYVYFDKAEEGFRKAVYDSKRSNYIKGDENTLFFRNKGLDKIEAITGQIGKIPVYIFKSGENFTSIKRFEDFLKLQIDCKEILLCDTYLSEVTLYPFSVIFDRIDIFRILTSKIYNKSKLDAYIEKIEKEFNISIEIKINKKLHDRFLIFENSSWIIGASLKDLGNKDSFIREISEIKNSVLELFELRWSEV